MALYGRDMTMNVAPYDRRVAMGSRTELVLGMARSEPIVLFGVT